MHVGLIFAVLWTPSTPPFGRFLSFRGEITEIRKRPNSDELGVYKTTTSYNGFKKRLLERQ